MSPDEVARRDAEDRALVERIAAVFAPPAMNEARAAAFDARLRERLEAGSRRGGAWLPALVTAAALAAVWFGAGLWGAGDPPRSVTARADAWEAELFLERDVASPADSTELPLPEDYGAIAVVFLDG